MRRSDNLIGSKRKRHMIGNNGNNGKVKAVIRNFNGQIHLLRIMQVTKVSATRNICQKSTGKNRNSPGYSTKHNVLFLCFFSPLLLISFLFQMVYVHFGITSVISFSCACTWVGEDIAKPYLDLFYSARTHAGNFHMQFAPDDLL